MAALCLASCASVDLEELACKMSQKSENNLDSFASGELNGYGSFISYKVGGAAMAEQAYLHGKPEYLKATAAAARQEWDEQFHTPDGMILPRWGEILERNAVFVDCAFAVCSFYIYAGLAVGLTTFGAAQKTADKDKGVLYTVETLNEKDGTIACAVVADPQQVADFCTSGDNELMCFDLKSGSSVTYEVGAGWSKDLRFDPRKLL